MELFLRFLSFVVIDFDLKIDRLDLFMTIRYKFIAISWNKYMKISSLGVTSLMNIFDVRKGKHH